MSQAAPVGLSGTAPAAPRRLTLIDAGIGAACVLMLIVFSQGWIMPIMGPKVDAAAGGIVRLIYFPAYLVGIGILLLHFGDFMRIIIRQPLLLLLLALAAVSYIWSINPGETLRRVIALFATSFAGMALAARYKWPQLVEIMAIAFGILCVLSFVMGLTIPRIGVMSETFPGAWRGLWSEKNALGNNMALFFPAFAAAGVLNPKRALIWVGMCVLCLLLLVLSTSKTSLLATLLAMAGLVFVAIVQKNRILGVLASYSAVLVVFAAVGIIVTASSLVFDLLGKDATLTGRTVIWTAIMIEVDKRPLLGHGYGTVWTETGMWGPLVWIVKHAGFKPIHAHSSWMEMLLWLGWIGLFAWIAVYVQTVTTALVTIYKDRGSYLTFPFLLGFSMISITESITLSYNDLRWVMFVAVACKLAYPDKAWDAARPPAARPLQPSPLRTPY